MGKETFSVHIQDAYIHGILHRPVLGLEQGSFQAYIFLHGWGGYRTGPHDMLVKLADLLCEGGYYVLRFDFRGKGYSGSKDFKPTIQSLHEDIDAVIRYTITKLNITNISLLGICSGAQLALEYACAGQTEITNVICLSLPPIQHDAKTVRQTTLIEAKQDLKHYAGLMFKKQTWHKVINRQINFNLIFHMFTKKICTLVHNCLPDPQNNSIKSKKEHCFSSFKGGVLLIYGDKDPEASVSLQQVDHWLRNQAIHYSSFYIKGANHSFYSLHWEKQVSKIIQTNMSIHQHVK